MPIHEAVFSTPTPSPDYDSIILLPRAGVLERAIT